MDTGGGAEGCRAASGGDATLPVLVLSEGGKQPNRLDANDPGDA